MIDKNTQAIGFIRQANEHLAQGEFFLAQALLVQARKKLPRELVLLPHLTRCHIFVGEHQKARALLVEYRQLAANDPLHLGQCAELCTQCKMTEVANDIYRELSSSGNSAAKYNFAANLLALGDLEQAENVLEDFLTEHPLDGQAHQVLSGIRRVDQKQNHVDRLRRTLSVSGLSQMDKIQLHYALGKELEDLAEFESAFEQFKLGASLRRKGMQYKVEGDVQTLQHILQQHGHLEPDENQKNEGDSAIFVFGLPRSGTTLVDRILSSHSDCDSFGEINDLPMSLIVNAGKNLPKDVLVRETAMWPGKKISSGYLKRLKNYESTARKHIDKTPLNFLYAGLIARTMPGASMIWMERHPLDSCFAMYKTLFKMGYPFSYDMQDLADYYIAYWKLKQQWKSALTESIRFQSYENLVQDFSQQAPQLVAHTGMDWQAGCGEFHKNSSAIATASSAQVRRPLYKSALAHWKNYEKELSPLVQRLESAGIPL